MKKGVLMQKHIMVYSRQGRQDGGSGKIKGMYFHDGLI